MKKLSLFLLAACLTVSAKDKPPEKPSLSSEQRVSILTAQRDLANAMVQAAPYEMMVQQKQGALQELGKKAEKEVDASKWKLNYATLEFEEVKQPEPPKMPEPKK